MTAPAIVIAGQHLGLDEAQERLERYPSSTPAIYDYPGPGQPSVITSRDIARTRRVSSRISAVEGDWFVALARTAPWTPAEEISETPTPQKPAGYTTRCSTCTTTSPKQNRRASTWRRSARCCI
jgi:hypothetical protein